MELQELMGKLNVQGRQFKLSTFPKASKKPPGLRLVTRSHLAPFLALNWNDASILSRYQNWSDSPFTPR